MNDSLLLHPKNRNLHQPSKLSLSVSSIHPDGMEIEIHRGDSSGARLAELALKPQPGDRVDSTHSVTLNRSRDAEDLCFVFKRWSRRTDPS